MVKVVFTTDRGFRHQEMALRGVPAGLDVVMLRKPSKENLIQNLAGAEYLISERSGVIDAEIIENAPTLKMIQRLGSLTFDIDLATAGQAGIAVCYMPIPGVIQVAEHVMMQIIAVGKKLREVESIALLASPEWGQSRRTDEDTFAFNWSKRKGINRIWGKTVGILGFGEVGSELARRLAGWGCAILYHKRSQYPQQLEAELNLEYVLPKYLLSRSDYLVNLLPYFPETDHFINANFINRMRHGAYLVSCGSGSTIDEAALTAAVRSGKLGGAALDTFEREPLESGNPLITAANEGFNILLTPHTAAVTPSGEAAAESSSRAMDYSNIIRHIKGETLKFRLV